MEREREKEREGIRETDSERRGGSSCRGGKKTGVKIRKIWGGGLARDGKRTNEGRGRFGARWKKIAG